MLPKKIQSALISVFYKDGLAPIIKKLHELNIAIYSTGGTQKFVEDLGVPVIRVEDLTGYPSILGGRVKTLHPKVFGGILGRRDNPEDLNQMNEYGIPALDLVIVDLYPFEETLKAGGTEEAIIEKIDIGGVSLIRAAAKNFKDALIIADKNDYPELLELLNSQNGETSLEQRKTFAGKAFHVTSHYDTLIHNHFNPSSPYLKLSCADGISLRYGENPHQRGTFFGKLDEVFEKLSGKELSYNNLVDTDAALQLISEFEEPGFVIVKHTNACGVATDINLLEAWKKALAGDPVSAFGGVITTNRKITEEVATAIDSLFFEILIAPDYEEEALEILKKKKNRNLLKLKKFEVQEKQIKSLLNGYLVQDADNKTETAADLKTVTLLSPTPEQVSDLLFAAKISKHVKSNTIVLAKNKQLLGMGSGQTSRVDALMQSIKKADSFGFDLKGSVMASDAFFPFPDCVEIAYNNGVAAVIQPGGSIKDELSIKFCNEHNMPMVFTGIRHFKH
jgi:phosphoribosylaminoimidazolecarboxamide formyltransferase/IMP cyclohydrolase